MDTPFHPADHAASELRDIARAASVHAHVPYSHFRVGAAVEFANGDIVTGCNVENASYGLTICAERTALVRSIAEGRDPADIRAIAIHVDSAQGQPCGACRQFMLELAPTATVSFLVDGELISCTASDLLPAAFIPSALDT